MSSAEACGHIGAIDEIGDRERRVRKACARIGSHWVHLGTCQESGFTLGSDDAPRRHAAAHVRATRHPLMASAESKGRWLDRYWHEIFAEY